MTNDMREDTRQVTKAPWFGKAIEMWGGTNTASAYDGEGLPEQVRTRQTQTIARVVGTKGEY